MLGVTRPLWEETWVWWAFNTGQKTLRREWGNRARTGNTAWQWALTQQRLQAMLIANKLNWSLQVDTVFLVTVIGEQLPYLSFDRVLSHSCLSYFIPCSEMEEWGWTRGCLAASWGHPIPTWFIQYLQSRHISGDFPSYLKTDFI